MEQVSLSDLMMPDPAVMEATEPVRYARRRMQTEALHSIIIVQDNRPVGIVESRHLRGITSDDLSRPVADFMVGNVPTLTDESSTDEAVSRLGHDVEVDQFPVVRSDGTLAGVVTRQTLVSLRDQGPNAVQVEEGRAPGGPVAAPHGSIRVGDMSYEVREGMSVGDADGSNLGTVSAVTIGRNGDVQTFDVQYGLIFKNHKRLTADLVRDVSDDTVYIILQSTDFKMIPDVEDANV